MRGRGVRALRGNALARQTDLARLRLRRTLRWALLLLVVPAVVLGASARAAELPRLASVEAHRHAVTATVLRAAPSQGVDAARVPSSGGTGLEVEWTYPAGTTHRATVRGPGGTAEVTVWVDDSGAPAGPPPTASTVTVDAVVYAVGAWLWGGVLLFLGTALLRRGLDRRDARAWTREWAEVEPYWSGRRRHGTADR